MRLLLPSLPVSLLVVTVLLVILAAQPVDSGWSRSRYSSYSSSSHWHWGRRRYSRYSGYRNHYHILNMGPIYKRRLSPSFMGIMYFGYASRYPNYFSYRRHTAHKGDNCINNLALGNGSRVGIFTCPFLPDEPRNWTRCCGYETEGFCCDKGYNDSWKNGLSPLAIIFLVLGGIVLLGIILHDWLLMAIMFAFYCCRTCLSSCWKRIKRRATQPDAKAATEPAKQPLGVTNPEPTPHPTMAYGTIQPQVGTDPYPPPYEGGK